MQYNATTILTTKPNGKWRPQGKDGRTKKKDSKNGMHASDEFCAETGLWCWQVKTQQLNFPQSQSEWTRLMYMCRMWLKEFMINAAMMLSYNATTKLTTKPKTVFKKRLCDKLRKQWKLKRSVQELGCDADVKKCDRFLTEPNGWNRVEKCPLGWIINPAVMLKPNATTRFTTQPRER